MRSKTTRIAENSNVDGCDMNQIILQRLLPWLVQHRAEIDALVLDVDGVLVRARKALPGVPEFLSFLKDERIPFTLLSNDSSTPIEDKPTYLKRAGVSVESSRFMSAGHALAPLAQRQGWTGHPFFLMGDLGRPCYAELAGLEVIRDADRIDEAVGIIVGENRYDWQRTVTAAFNRLRRKPETPLVVPNPDEFYPGRAGRLVPGSGAIARFICSLCRNAGVRISPVWLGKPYRPIFRANHTRLEQIAGQRLQRQRVLMVGDSLTGDVRGAGRFGYRTALVLTGITSEQMLAASRIRPDHVFQGL